MRKFKMVISTKICSDLLLMEYIYISVATVAILFANISHSLSSIISLTLFVDFFVALLFFGKNMKFALFQWKLPFSVYYDIDICLAWEDNSII